MRLLPLLLHAAAAKLQFGADANNTRKGSKRRRNIERVYAVARKALPLEEKLEAEERWERARLLGRNRRAKLASIKNQLNIGGNDLITTKIINKDKMALKLLVLICLLIRSNCLIPLYSILIK